MAFHKPYHKQGRSTVTDTDQHIRQRIAEQRKVDHALYMANVHRYQRQERQRILFNHPLVRRVA